MSCRTMEPYVSVKISAFCAGSKPLLTRPQALERKRARSEVQRRKAYDGFHQPYAEGQIEPLCTKKELVTRCKAGLANLGPLILLAYCLQPAP